MRDTTQEALKLFGYRIKRRRERLRLTQTEICKVAGVSQSTFTRIERGEGYGPQISTLPRLAAALGLTAVELLNLYELAVKQTSDEFLNGGKDNG